MARMSMEFMDNVRFNADDDAGTSDADFSAVTGGMLGAAGEHKNTSQSQDQLVEIEPVILDDDKLGLEKFVKVHTLTDYVLQETSFPAKTDEQKLAIA